MGKKRRRNATKCRAFDLRFHFHPSTFLEKKCWLLWKSFLKAQIALKVPNNMETKCDVQKKFHSLFSAPSFSHNLQKQLPSPSVGPSAHQPLHVPHVGILCHIIRPEDLCQKATTWHSLQEPSKNHSHNFCLSVLIQWKSQSSWSSPWLKQSFTYLQLVFSTLVIVFLLINNISYSSQVCQFITIDLIDLVPHLLESFAQSNCHRPGHVHPAIFGGLHHSNWAIHLDQVHLMLCLFLLGKFARCWNPTVWFGGAIRICHWPSGWNLH